MKIILRIGSDYDDIDNKESSVIWLNPNGKIYVKKSLQFNLVGWKIDEKEKIIDYWGKEWFRLLPVIDLWLKNNSQGWPM